VGTRIVPMTLRADATTGVDVEIDVPTARVKRECEEVGKGPLVKQRIRILDRLSTAYEPSALTLEVDGRPLFAKADEPTIVAAMRGSQAPTFTMSLPAGCHVFHLDMTYVGTVDPIQNYRFEVTSTRAFDTAEGELVEIELYEANNGPYSERPALRFRYANPRPFP
jgi:hypothetical protein